MNPSIDFSQANRTSGRQESVPVVTSLQRCPVLAQFPEPILKELADACTRKTYDKGVVLAQQGAIAHTIWLINDGWVKQSRETLDGSEAVWSVAGARRLVGLETLVPPYQYTTRMVAATPLSAIAIPQLVLRQILESQANLAMLLLKHSLVMHQNEQLEIEHRAHQSAPQRIGCYLLKLANTPEKGAITVKMPFDKSLLAARLGMQPETFSRALATLRKDTGLIWDGAIVTIPDVIKLQDYACVACSGFYPCRREL